MNSRKPAANNGKPFSIVNRKYLGSKRELAQKIIENIISISGMPDVFFDGFCGTGAVSAKLIASGLRKIIACDNLYSNTVILEGFFRLKKADGQVFESALETLNALEGKNGYITEHFAGIYFTRANCRRMDAIRENIESLRRKQLISEHVAFSLLASFLLAADRVANTLGQYDAYLKNIDSFGYRGDRHVTDTRIHQKFMLKTLQFLPDIDRKIIHDDIVKVISLVKADTAYFDPPYNGRQYCDNYHVLENIARWEKPAVFGKTKKYDRRGLKSSFSSRRQAKNALRALLCQTRIPHVYLSYNSEGILAKEEIISLLAEFGKPDLFEIPYPVFGKGAGVSRKRLVTEYLFHVKK